MAVGRVAGALRGPTISFHTPDAKHQPEVPFQTPDKTFSGVSEGPWVRLSLGDPERHASIERPQHVLRVNDYNSRQIPKENF